MAAEHNTPEARAAQRLAIKSLKAEAKFGNNWVSMTGARALALANIFAVNVSEADQQTLMNDRFTLFWQRQIVELSRPGVVRLEVARIVRNFLN